ncbi:MAG: TRAP transporter large permease [Dehalococcoidales bacterium]|nr:TRAP transporter large permease [Dehalococcoidales bacterium]
MFVLVMVGVPIFISMAIASLVGFWLVGGQALTFQQFSTEPYFVSASYILAVIPLFILMGIIAGETGIADSTYNAITKLMGGLRGGVLMATVGAGALFGACCGMGIAAAAVFTTLALPELDKQHYDRPLSLGAICLSGSLSGLIPPSIGMVIMCIITEQSVGRGLVSLIVPGVLLALLTMVIIWSIGKINPQKIPKTIVHYTWKEKLSSLVQIWPVLFIFIIVIGGMLAGFFPPTIGGAIGAAGVLIYAAIRRTKMRKIYNGFRESVLTNAQLFPLVLAGFLFARFVAISGLPRELADLISTANLSPYLLMFVVMIFYLIIGCVFEFLSMAIVTLPIIFPIMTAAGFDPIATLVIVAFLGEIAALTPPVGLSAFIVAGVARTKPEQVFKGVLPYFATMLILMWLVVFFPKFATWLPNLFYGVSY